MKFDPQGQVMRPEVFVGKAEVGTDGTGDSAEIDCGRRQSAVDVGVIVGARTNNTIPQEYGIAQLQAAVVGEVDPNVEAQFRQDAEDGPGMTADIAGQRQNS